MTPADGVDWSVEGELIAMAGGTTSLPEALAKLGLLNQAGSARTVSVTLIDDWHRGGAETYVASFRLDVDRQSRLLFLKALVPFVGTKSVQDAIDMYLARANALATVGIATPETYAAHRGTLLQEHVPTAFAEAIVRAEPELAASLITRALDARVALGRAGFEPLQFFSDLRVDGEKVVLVDLGADLLACASHAVELAVVHTECLRWLRVAVTQKARRELLIDAAGNWLRGHSARDVAVGG